MIGYGGNNMHLKNIRFSWEKTVTESVPDHRCVALLRKPDPTAAEASQSTFAHGRWIPLTDHNRC